jgi:hypothetical protein
MAGMHDTPYADLPAGNRKVPEWYFVVDAFAAVILLFTILGSLLALFEAARLLLH